MIDELNWYENIGLSRLGYLLYHHMIQMNTNVSFSNHTEPVRFFYNNLVFI